MLKKPRHILMCGDSTSKDDVDRLMDGEKADMVFTDPPYGMNLDTDYSKLPDTNRMGKAKTFKSVHGDDNEFNPTFILEYFDYCNEILLFGADYYAKYLPQGSWYVWDKRCDENFDKMIGSAFELCWSKSKHKREIARFNNTLFSGEIEAKNKVHPTQKPTKMFEWFFERIKGNVVVDLFLGSGSTLIACEKTNRKCYGSEIDPHYCSVIIKRWQDFTGEVALKLHRKETAYERLP
jgi:DNA modification methylase